MRVLMWMLGGQLPGGHIVQMEQTCIHLRRLGVDVVQVSETEPALEGFDLVHSFGVDYPKLERCRDLGIPIVSSTIYHPCYIDPDRKWKITRHLVRVGAELFLSALRGDYAEKCQGLTMGTRVYGLAYQMSNMLLPNSESEARAIVRELGVTTPSHVVPNAADPDLFHLPEEGDQTDRQTVLCAGRIEPRKQQLELIKALRGTRVPLVLAGFPHPGHTGYYRECVRLADSSVTIQPPVPHEEMGRLYARARVHALPSKIETTGLVSLEAALCGCNVVTTNRGYTRDYFGDMAWYCDPYDLKSIREAVLAAYHAPFRADLREHILGHYTWEHTARATLQAYEKVLATRRLANFASR